MPHRNHGMYRVSRLLSSGCRQAGIISVDKIVSSVHLFLRLISNLSLSDKLNCFTVLEHCYSFYINPFSSRDMFLLFS